MIYLGRGDLQSFQKHPLGFLYKNMVNSGISQRIHVWLDSRSIPLANDRHSHAYDIDSTVVLGEMRSEILRFEEDHKGDTNEFLVQYKENRSSLKATGRVGFTSVLCRFNCRAGSSYFLTAGVIHRVKIQHFPCVSVVTTTPKDLPVFSYGDSMEEPPFLRSPVTDRDIRRLLEVLKSIPQESALHFKQE